MDNKSIKKLYKYKKEIKLKMRRVTHNKIANATPETIVKEWYHKSYKTDPEWETLDVFTFYDIFTLLDNYYSPEFGDSIIRERIFQKLAEIMDVDYHYIYEQWINAKKSINMTIYDFGSDMITWEDFENGEMIRESAFNDYQMYDIANKEYDDIYYQFYYTLDELYCDGELTLLDLKKIKNGTSDELFNAMLIKITADLDGSIVNKDFSLSKEDKDFYTKILQDAASNYLSDIGINESWRELPEEDIERFRGRYNELKSDTKRSHKWLDFPRSAEDVIANNQDKVADQVFDFIESHKQYFAPDSGIYNGKFFYIEKKFNKGMGRTRLCKIDPTTKTIHLTNVANRFDIRYLEESFPKFKIEKDDKYSPWDRRSW